VLALVDEGTELPLIVVIPVVVTLEAGRSGRMRGPGDDEGRGERQGQADEHPGEAASPGHIVSLL
jgi:hypothetical protein